jgi:predicted amidohydrolase
VPEPLRIAAIQNPVTVDPEANGTAARALIRRAHAQGARLGHLPEGAITGYAGTDKDFYRGWNIDWAPGRRELEATAELAAELGMWIVVGGNHPLTGGHWPHNSTYVISDRGELVDRYDKRLLSSSEVHEFYTPRTRPVVFTVEGFTFGILTCIEVQFPELWVEYARLGVDCFLFGSYSQDPVFDLILRGHAATTNMWISVSVPAQCSTAMPAGLIGPHGSWPVECARDGQPGFVCADLDPGDPDLEIAVHRAKPWRATARQGDIHRQRIVTDPRSTDRTSF